MILRKYKNNLFYFYSLAFFIFLFLIKININYSYIQHIYKFKNTIDKNTLQTDLNIDDFLNNLRGNHKIYGYGTEIFREYPIAVNDSKTVLKVISLYKANNFEKKNKIVNNSLSKNFNFNVEYKKINKNFLAIHLVLSLVLCSAVFILLRNFFVKK